MSLWRKLFGDGPSNAPRPARLDYLNEALALERQGDFEGALTSYRLALRGAPDDVRLLQNIAILYSKTDQPEEAIRYYRRALDLDAALPGAHYGLGFLLVKRGQLAEGAAHLREFLARPLKGPEAEKWVRHAEGTLRQVEASLAADPS
ncbi:MAG TPA: tetratricopeptide repeat protein [Gemmatimonadales bacterium]|jgi:Flp pilus assembly protein TadD|nr:tetratricopeptide repeat protein [Gemmatimonadales bacterium]